MRRALVSANRLRIIAFWFFAVFFALLAYGWRVAPRRLHVTRLSVSLPDLPREWDGLRIGHLSDFHFGGRGVSVNMLRRARDVVEQFRPDLIALTGDYYDDGRLADSEALFRDWPGESYVFAVLGNHDDRGGEEHVNAVVSELEGVGVRVLRNRSASIELRGRTAWVVGVDDPYAWRMDDDQAFRDVPDDQDVLLYLAHSPAAIWTMPVGRVRVLLSGHTHGGQIRITPSGRIPFVERIRRLKGAPVRNDPPVFRGVHRLRGAIVVVSNGLGVSQLPFRFRAAPEVVLIELSSTAAADDGLAACDDVNRYVSRRRSGGFVVATAIVPSATSADNRRWRLAARRRISDGRGGEHA